MKNLFCLIILLLLPAMVWGAATPTQQIDRQEMEQVLNDFLSEKSDLLPNVELRYRSVSLPKPYSVPQGRLVHQVIPARPGVIGSRRMTLVTRVDGRTVSNQSVRVDIEALAEVAVATSGVAAGGSARPGRY